MIYLAIIEKADCNFSAFVPDAPGAVGVAETREATLESLAQGLALMLHDLTERGLPLPMPRRREKLDLAEFSPEEPYEIVEIRPALMNPVSLAIEGSIRDSGLSEAEVARRMGSSRAAMTRITDPFYFGHTVSTLRKLADALDQELEVQFVPKTAA